MRERMNASFGVNDHDINSSIGLVREGIAVGENVLPEGDAGIASRLCELGGEGDVRSVVDDGGPGTVGARRLPEWGGPEAGGTRKAPETGAGHGTFAGGAPTSRSEAAEGAPMRSEPEVGGPEETGASGRKLVDGGGAAGGAATGAVNDVVTGPAGRAR